MPSLFHYCCWPMLVVVSPAKSLDFESQLSTQNFTQPQFLVHSQELIDQLQGLAPQDIASLMKLSDKLAQLNYERFQDFQQPFSPDNARQAVLAFTGDVYQGLQAQQMSEQDLAFAQDHLRILSGLYGLLKPLDLMQAYRLEMGTKFENSRGKNLYEFWGDILNRELNLLLSIQAQTQHSEAVLINLASNEYFKAAQAKQLQYPVITPVFKDFKNGQYKIISFYAKKARGLMARFIIENRLTHVEQLKGFDLEGYGFCEKSSNDQELVFLREE